MVVGERKRERQTDEEAEGGGGSRETEGAEE